METNETAHTQPGADDLTLVALTPVRSHARHRTEALSPEATE